ncbi:MAG: hypothetical protein OXN97_21395 [Bryobacterales bacterium]|nr:hypothetical protein [Bryobacterales bacterium]
MTAAAFRAISEAAQRPTTHFVAVKTETQQALRATAPAIGSMSLACVRGPLADATFGVQLARCLCHLRKGRT